MRIGQTAMPGSTASWAALQVESAAAQPPEQTAQTQGADAPIQNAAAAPLPIDDLPALAVDLYPNAVVPEPKANTYGESYWKLLHNVGETYDGFREASASVGRDGEAISVRDLVEIQRKSIEYSVLVDFASKVTDRLSQGVQTLMRNQ